MLVLVFVAACGGGNRSGGHDGGVRGDAPAASAAAIAAVAGQGQRGAVGQALASPLVVKVTSAAGTPLAGVTVAWSAAAGGGSVAPATSATGSDGTASAIATLGTVAGANVFQAAVAGLAGSPAGFPATADAGPVAALIAVSGDGQRGAVGQALSAALVVKASDEFGNAVAAVAVAWSAAAGGGAVSPADATTGADGTATCSATLGGAAAPNVFRARAGSVAPVDFSEIVSPGLYYTDPPAGGKLRLVRNAAASTATTVALDLVAGAAMDAYAVGLTLPLSAGAVRLGGGAFVPGDALNAGQPPLAAGAAIGRRGPLAGALVTALSQKAAGAGAVTADAAVAPGQRFYTVTLALDPSAPAGVVFDGAAKSMTMSTTMSTTTSAAFSAGARNRAGTDVATSGDLAIGKLEIR